MDHTGNNLKPWNNIRLFKRNSITINSTFELEPKEYNHTISEEEATLHEYRNRINEYETTLNNGKNWEYYKKVVNPYELVYTQKKYDNFPESICILKPLSRSYFKMTEMLELINFFGTFRSENVRGAHVCEGPGGFIEALYDEAFKNRKKVQTSIAMTLKQLNYHKNIIGELLNRLRNLITVGILMKLMGYTIMFLAINITVVNICRHLCTR